MFGVEFYPTSRELADRAVEKFQRKPNFMLEPQAGKGDLVDAVYRKWGYRPYRSFDREGDALVVDIKIRCIEIDPALCAVLVQKGYTVMDSDWLKFQEPCSFDSVLMNPPFSNGIDHLEHALDWADDTEIVCILNSSNIKNPYTETRKRVVDRLTALSADIEYIEGAFQNAERETDVEVALIHVYVPRKSEADRITGFVEKTQEFRPDSVPLENLPARLDILGNMEHYFNSAVKAKFAAFDYDDASARYIQAMRLDPESKTVKAESSDTIRVDKRRGEWLDTFRQDAWKAVLHRPEFFAVLDKLQREQFIADSSKAGGIAFTASNIKATLEAIILQRQKYFEQSAANVFKALTTHYKENTESSLITDVHRRRSGGWKSNRAHKVNKRIVFPYGVSYDKKFDSFSSICRSGSIDVSNDLDRILCVMTGTKFEKSAKEKDKDACDKIEDAIRRCLHKYDQAKMLSCPKDYYTKIHENRWAYDLVASGNSLSASEMSAYSVYQEFSYKANAFAKDKEEAKRKALKDESKWFDVRIFKAGTVHLIWKDEQLREEFNVLCCRGMRWLGE